MSDDTWQSLEACFNHAVELAPEQRERYLDEACAQTPDLRRRVEELLSHHDEASDGFMSGCEHKGGAQDAEDLIGHRIGQYTIRSKLGSGGMGTVWKADQDNPRRAVALKMLGSRISSTHMLWRFQREAEFLATLDHANIAHVYEAGLHRPADTALRIPYFVMEYVAEARSLIQYARDSSLSLRDRLVLFTDVCDAVHYGHQKGIMHRDLKPSNILVDSSGRVKVIDFGVARSTDADIALTTMHTQVGQLIGTLQYMSPEQCDADPRNIDTRSDVYSLGVVLYELVCSQLPYDLTGAAPPVALRRICEDEPVSPKQLDRRCHADLDCIIMKALEKDRSRRYQSAAELKNDLNRFSTGEPVEARPPTIVNRAFRSAYRHPLATTTVACLVIAATTVVATWVAVWWQRLPSNLLIADDKLSVVAQAVNGDTLKKWSLQSPNKYMDAALISCPPERCTGTMAVLGSEWPSYQHDAALCAFAVRARHLEPVWKGAFESSHLPQQAIDRQLDPEVLGVDRIIVEDVFDDYDGDELIVVHKGAGRGENPSTYSAIRVYSSSGQVLFQTWYRGSISSATWVPEPRLIVLGALDNDSSLKELGYEPQHRHYPFVVLAVRPIHDHLGSSVMTTSDIDSSPELVWYKVLLPPNSSDMIAKMEVGIAPPPDRRKYFHVHLLVDRELGATISWLVDENGATKADSRSINDSYRVNSDQLPLQEKFVLGELPRSE